MPSPLQSATIKLRKVNSALVLITTPGAVHVHSRPLPLAGPSRLRGAGSEGAARVTGNFSLYEVPTENSVLCTYPLCTRNTGSLSSYSPPTHT